METLEPTIRLTSVDFAGVRRADPAFDPALRSLSSARVVMARFPLRLPVRRLFPSLRERPSALIGAQTRHQGFHGEHRLWSGPLRKIKKSNHGAA